MTKADIRIHNVVFICAVCGELHQVKDVQPIAILKLNGIKPVEKKPEEFDMLYVTVFVCPDCFDEEGMDKEAPPEIVKK